MKEKESDKEKIDRVERGVEMVAVGPVGKLVAEKIIDVVKMMPKMPTSGLTAPFPGQSRGGLVGWLARKIFKK